MAPPTDLDVLADDVKAVAIQAGKLEKKVEENLLRPFSRGFTVVNEQLGSPDQSKMDPEARADTEADVCDRMMRRTSPVALQRMRLHGCHGLQRSATWGG